MQGIMDTTRGLSLLLRLQSDRMLTVAAVAGALPAGAWLSSLYLI